MRVALYIVMLFLLPVLLEAVWTVGIFIANDWLSENTTTDEKDGVPFSSKITTASLIIGICSCIAIALCETIDIYGLVAHQLIVWTDTAHPAVAFMVGCGFGGLIGLGIYEHGHFKIVPGQFGYGSVTGVPISRLRFGPGDGVLPYLLMSLTIVSSQGYEIIMPEDQFTTADGVPVFASIDALARVIDPLKVQNIEGGSIDAFMKSVLGAATRHFIIERTADIDRMFISGGNEALSNEEVWEIVKTVSGLKASVSTDGTEAVRKDVCKRAKSNGLELESVQIKNVHFSEEIEREIERIYDEVFQKMSRTKDAKNKRLVVQELCGMFEDHGIRLTSLPPELGAEFIDRMADRALAMEGQGNNSRINFGNQAPRGALVNIGGTK